MNSAPENETPVQDEFVRRIVVALEGSGLGLSREGRDNSLYAQGHDDAIDLAIRLLRHDGCRAAVGADPTVHGQGPCGPPTEPLSHYAEPPPVLPERPQNTGPGSEQWEQECEEFGCHEEGASS